MLFCLEIFLEIPIRCVADKMFWTKSNDATTRCVSHILLLMYTQYVI